MRFFFKNRAKFRPGSSAGPEHLYQRSMKVTNTVHRRHSQRMYTHPYKYMHVNPTSRSIFEDCAGKSSKLTKSPQAPRCRQEHRLPLKAQTPLNPEKFALIRSRTENLIGYRSSRNQEARGPSAQQAKWGRRFLLYYASYSAGGGRINGGRCPRQLVEPSKKRRNPNANSQPPPAAAAAPNR
jgi:hypothetical protein